DSGYRRLESNLGINEAFLSMSYPEFIDEDGRLTLIAGAYTNRYGAAGRYDAGRYETYLFGRTHVAGVTATFDQDVGDWTGEFEGSFGGKLEPIPFYGPPGAPGMTTPANQQLPAWEPYPGPVPQESTFVWSAHLGAVYKKMVIAGLHFIDVFANDNERAGSYAGGTNPSWDGTYGIVAGRSERLFDQHVFPSRESPHGEVVGGCRGGRDCKRFHVRVGQEILEV